MPRASVLTLAAAGLALSSIDVAAQQVVAPSALSDGWIVTLKGRAYTYPSYPGASSQSLAALPGLSFRRAGSVAAFGFSRFGGG